MNDTPPNPPALLTPERIAEIKAIAAKAEKQYPGAITPFKCRDLLALCDAVEANARLTHERDALGRAIGEAAIKAGIVKDDIDGLTGPQLIMLADNLQFAGKVFEQTSKGLFAENARLVAQAERLAAALDAYLDAYENDEDVADPKIVDTAHFALAEYRAAGRGEPTPTGEVRDDPSRENPS